MREPPILLYTWGDGSRGALGHGTVDREESPRLCLALLPYRLRAVACGAGTTLMRTAAGDVCACGSYSRSEL